MSKENRDNNGNLNLNFVKEFIEFSKKWDIEPIDLSTFTKINETVKNLSQQINPLNNFSSLLTSDIQKTLSALSEPKINFPVMDLSLSLDTISRWDKSLSDKIAEIAKSQIILSNNLTRLGNLLNQNLSEFNTLKFALNGITTDYFQSLAKTKNLEESEFIIEVNDSISIPTSELISGDQELMGYVPNYFLKRIIDNLYILLKKANRDRTKQYVRDVILIISFSLNLYSLFDKSNTQVAQELTQEIRKEKDQISVELINSKRDILEETRKEIKEANEELFEQIKTELDKLNKKRIAKRETVLKYSPMKKSKKIGILKEGQEVIVLEIRHKYLLVSYLDKDSNEPKSGFVIKKYFEIVK